MAVVNILAHSAEIARGADSLDYNVNHLKIFVIVILVISVCSLVLRFWSRLIAPDVSIGYVLVCPLRGSMLTFSTVRRIGLLSLRWLV